MNHEIELEVTDLARGGAGVSRDQAGRVIFVPYTAPGDRVRVRIVEEDRRYAQAELIEVLEPSKIRVQPRCPVFGRCGGCQWQHLPYDLQWKTKVDGLQHALHRVQVPVSFALEECPAEKIWEYRNRVQLRGVPTKSGDLPQIGFFRNRSRDLVAAERCDIADPRINESWKETREMASSLRRPFKVEVEISPEGELVRNWNQRHAAGGFRQVHDEQNEKMKEWITQAVHPVGRLFDLFGGAGNLSRPLAGKVREIDCVDTGAPLAAPQVISSPFGEACFNSHRSSVLPWLLKEAEKGKGQEAPSPSVAILDPPREGLLEGFSEVAIALEKLGVRQIVAVGCDPDAWARDLSRWVKRGWKLERILAVDLFPQTPHIEAVGVLGL